MAEPQFKQHRDTPASTDQLCWRQHDRTDCKHYGSYSHASDKRHARRLDQHHIC